MTEYYGRNGIEVSPEEIIITSGGSGRGALLFPRRSLDPGVR